MQAVDDAFAGDVDYAQLHKIFSSDSSGKYSPGVCIGCEAKVVAGEPNPRHINTSYVERNNLTMRMHMRRFTRLTNAFSKKAEMHAAAVALHFMHYNFVKIHQTLRVTPAMEAGIAGHAWDLSELVALLP
jgi:hypothetical protein